MITRAIKFLALLWHADEYGWPSTPLPEDAMTEIDELREKISPKAWRYRDSEFEPWMVENWDYMSKAAEEVMRGRRKVVEALYTEADVLSLLSSRTISEAVVRALEELDRLSSSSYCRSLDKFSAVPCLGWESKVRSGLYTAVEHEAHAEANRLMGRHQGFAEAAKTIRSALVSGSGAAVPGEDGWKLIDTAPKDGTKFDAWIPDAFGGLRITDLSFNARGQLRQNGILTAAELPRWPTHWRPLPAPPLSGEERT